MDCTCGTRYGLDKGATSENSGGGEPSRNTASSLTSKPLDASFVHLPPSLLVQQDERRSVQSKTSSESSAVERYRHLDFLENAANSASNPPAMCRECVQRVERAMEADTERIESESRLYREMIREEQLRVKNWKRALRSATESSSSNSDEHDSPACMDEVERASQTFQAEIEMLREACQQNEEEILHLQSVRKELSLLSRELDQAEEALFEEQNALELEARAFENDQEQLHRILAEIQGESERLSSPTIRLPSLLLDLQVDKERGLRYPLINDLRLAYRPKGDVQWEEIQAAWSLAAQLLLYVGTLFQFQSRHWRIVPLSSCAKLIFYPPKEGVEKGTSGGDAHPKGAVVYNLGHPKTQSSRAFLAWNALLHQLASSVLATMEQACDEGLMDPEVVPRLPFEMTSVKIGEIVLTELGENDDAGWSRAIHCMSCNLLWLSDCASVFLRHQILPQCLI